MLILYADVLFAINFSMDFLALFFTSALLHIKFKKTRIIVGSLFGAVYGLIQVFINMNLIIKLTVSTLIAIVMVTVSFQGLRLKRIFFVSLTYLFVSMTLGGIMTLLYTFFNSILAEFLNKYTNEETYNGARIFVIIALTAIAALIFSRILAKKKSVKAVKVEVFLDGEKFTLSGLCDTGNLLTEPFSGKCVVLVPDKSVMGKAIDEMNDLRKKYIPYKDITGTGMLKGVIPDKIFIDDNLVSAVVATSKSGDFSGYEALVPGALL